METGEKKIKMPATGLCDFPKLILGEEAKYVDKTDLLYSLASSTADAQLFISRPRRFGKSLMLSTLQAMFEGRRELFKGLAIDKLPWEGWEKPTPVYSFTMSSANGVNYDGFLSALSKLVKGLCEQIGLAYNALVDASVIFEEFLRVAAEKSPTKQIAFGDWKGYLYESLYGLYASVPVDWRIRDEAEAKRYFQLFTAMTGANPQPEVVSIFGYADAVIETPGAVYVFEFKDRKSAKAAIRQIRDRGYADKWIGGPRPVTLVGINFNPKKRNIDMPIIEPA